VRHRRRSSGLSDDLNIRLDRIGAAPQIVRFRFDNEPCLAVAQCRRLLLAGLESLDLRRFVAAPEHQAMRCFMELENGITRSVLFNDAGEPAHAMRILDVHLNRRKVPDGRHRRIDFERGAAR
jgi:hypothetical protein